MANVWLPHRTGPVEIHPVETDAGLILLAGMALEPIHALQLALQLALELERVAGAAYSRQRALYSAQLWLPLFEPAREVGDGR